MEDKGLKREVRSAARGDRQAAALLFDTYHPRLYRYALAKLGSPADADDVASETFARVLSKLDGFRWTGGGFEAWLFKIASNLITDRYRSAARERPTDDQVEEQETAMEHLPEDRTLHLESSRELDQMLHDLPDEQREVLLLRFAAGLDTHETAAIMKKNVNAIRQLQFRALENIRSRNPIPAVSQ
ncbi:MAG: polymerase sigma-70 factor, subfamily [Actinomycetota bacterium]|nr:polymerase sigma-70 factor, subfamily [Actinomycetota bacterium]